MIHLNTSWWKGFLAEKVARKMGVKEILVHARNTFIDINDEEKRNLELLNHEKCKKEFNLSLATHFMACSREAADFLFGPQIPRERIVLFHNALDISRYRYDILMRARMRKLLGVEDKYIIGNIGRMVYQKNHAFLIESFCALLECVPEAVLLLIGGGELEDNIREQIVECGIAEHVIFAGEVDNVEDYLQAMDAFAFPTGFEGLGNVLIEAQTAGLKCITSENVPRETCITENIVYLPLEKDKWIKEMKKYAVGYQRKNMDARIREAGYDITEEIKVLENIYLESRNG